MANTRETMGEQACLDALVADTLTEFEDDGISAVGAQALRYHDALTSVTMSQCKKVNEYGLANCTNLEVVDIQGTGNIAANAFNGDTKLKHVILRGSTRGTLYSSNVFAGTPFTVGEGAIYVPSTLVDSYKSGTNWPSFIILPIEAYPATDFSTISDSWSDIITAVGNGTYDSKYAIGDTKSIVIDGTTYYMQLVAKDTDVLATDGVTTVPTTWLMYKKLYGTTHRVNPQNNSGAQGTGINGGWEYSELRSWLSTTVFQLLPQEVKTAIKEVRKYSGGPEDGTIVQDRVTSDKLWIPSYYELNINSTYETQGAAYSTTIYPSGNNSMAKSARIKYDQSDNASKWWLREPSQIQDNWCCVGTGGENNSTYLYQNNGVCLGFCI